MEKIKSTIMKCKEFLMSYGILGVVWTLEKRVAILIFYLATGRCVKEWCKEKCDEIEEKKKRDEEKRRNQEKLLIYWECYWKRLGGTGLECRKLQVCDKKNKGLCYGGEDAFLEKFCAIYRFVERKEQENKRKNFFWKGMFVFVLSMGAMAFLALLCINIIKNKDIIPVVAENSLLLFVIVLVCGTISKWTDIKKYQETWSRHSQHKYLLDKQMLLFIYDRPPYHTEKKKKEFFNTVMDIWEANEKKFIKNMEEKEKTMMDIFSQIKTNSFS